MKSAGLGNRELLSENKQKRWRVQHIYLSVKTQANDRTQTCTRPHLRNKEPRTKQSQSPNHKIFKAYGT